MPLMNVITRFAPSPTGLLHTGNYRTALFSYIFARQNKGKFILRIEDTDKARSKKEYEDNIVESLKWLGLEYDGFDRQSDRIAIHQQYIQKLIDSGHAYVSKETPKEPGGRTEVIRFKNPNKKIGWNDIIRGPIEFDTTELKDFVIARSMTEPVFHLVVVVDDHEMGVTHIIRGEDHISNTPRQLLIYEALGLFKPLYAHLPLLLAPDRSKLSKRKGALPVTEYKDRGYLPEALVNYMALLGWNPGTTEEIMPFSDIVSKFRLEDVQKSGAMFNEEKLAWINKEYISRMTSHVFEEKVSTMIPESILSNPQMTERLLPIIRERIHTFDEVPKLFVPGGEFDFIITTPSYSKESLFWKEEKDAAKTQSHLAQVIDLLKNFAAKNPSIVTATAIKEVIWPYADAHGRGNVLWPTRVALSGKNKSPDPFTLIEIFGLDESIRRLGLAHDILN